MSANVAMTLTDCTCGIPFSMPTRLYNKCRESGDDFYCPAGHCLTFTTKSKARAILEKHPKIATKETGPAPDDITATGEVE